MTYTPVFPAAGNRYTADFGPLAFVLDFDADGQHMSFASAEAPGGESQTVRYTAVPLREGLFLVYWTEADGTTVTHVEDFAEGRVHTNITSPDGTFTNLTGTLDRAS